MKTTPVWTIFLGVLLALGASDALHAQTIDGPKSCANIGGTWGAPITLPANRENRPVQRYGRCLLRRPYEVRRNTTLRIEVGVELAVSYGGRLTNNGYVEIPDTSALMVVGGSFFNNGNLYTDNSGEIWFFIGRFDNTGTMSVEGDLFTEPLGTLTPQSPNACLNNSGSMTFFSGGNVHSRGCIDSRSGGTFDVLQTATFNNYGIAHYRSGRNDVVDGRFNNHWNAYAEVHGRVMVMGNGHIENAGQLQITNGALTLTAGSTMRTPHGGSLTFAGGDMHIDGTYTIRGGVTTAIGTGSGDDELSLGQSGQLNVESGSKVWSSAHIDIANEGSIRLGCIVFWYQPADFVGNPLFRKYCGGTPITPPWIPLHVPSL